MSTKELCIMVHILRSVYYTLHQLYSQIILLKLYVSLLQYTYQRLSSCGFIFQLFGPTINKIQSQYSMKHST